MLGLGKNGKFKKSAKEILLSRYIGTMIGFVNDPAIREVENVQPVIAELLHNLISVAYPTPLDARDLNIGSMKYFDAQITDARSQNVIAFNGKTDFSVIYSPKDISLGGCEIKLPKKGLEDNKRTTSVAKRAVAQTGTQILGAVQKLKKHMVNVLPFTMMTTNGWQWIFVQRKLGVDDSSYFYHLPPISLGERQAVVDASAAAVIQDDEHAEDDESDGGEETESKKDSLIRKRHVVVVMKSEDDDCYDQLSHLLALMFDNIEFLWRQADSSTSALAEKMEVMSFSLHNEYSSVSDNGSNAAAENKPGKEVSTTSAAEKNKTTAVGTKKKAAAVQIATSLRERNENIFVGRELTAQNLALLNLGL